MVYVPLSRSGRGEAIGNRGYAFVNFKLPEDATAFANTFKDVAIPDCASTKRLFTNPASHQGYITNIIIEVFLYSTSLYLP